MDARTGKQIRLGRLRDTESGKYFIVAYSHGVLMGAIPGLRTRAELRNFTRSVSDVGGLMVTPGVLPLVEEAFIGRDRPSLVIHLDWQSYSRSTLPYDQGACAQLADIDQVVAAGADAVMTYLYIGHDDPREERAEIERNARIVGECRRYGLPVMIEPRSSRERLTPTDKTDVEIMSMYCRMSAELGADLVKCIYPGTTELLAKIVEECPVPLLVAGGARKDDPASGFEIAHSAMAAGAEGIVFGRNIYQAEDPASVVRTLNGILRGDSVRSH